MLLDEGVEFVERLDLLEFLRRGLETKFALDGYDNIHKIERVDTDVLTKASRRRELVLLYFKFVNQNGVYFFCEYFFCHVVFVCLCLFDGANSDTPMNVSYFCQLLLADQNAMAAVTDAVVNGLDAEACCGNKAGHIIGVVHLAVAVRQRREIERGLR